MKKTYIIYPKCKIGKNTQIGDFVVIGLPPRGKKKGELETAIGDNAIIRSHTVIYAGNMIGDNFESGHKVMLRENNRIGNNVSIGTGTVIEHDVEIADNVRIHSQAFIPEFSSLGDGCWVGPNVVFTNALHPLCPQAKKCLKGPVLKRGAKIGANATLLPNIVIGEKAVVGAGSVVTKDVPDGKVVVGNPATVIKNIGELNCPFGLIDKPY